MGVLPRVGVLPHLPLRHRGYDISLTSSSGGQSPGVTPCLMCVSEQAVDAICRPHATLLRFQQTHDASTILQKS